MALKKKYLENKSLCEVRSDIFVIKRSSPNCKHSTSRRRVQ